MAAKTDLVKALTYELCTFPKALMESPDLLHEAQKSMFADSIWACINHTDSLVPKKVQYVLDGGALLHRIPWNRGSSYGSIVPSYIDYV